MQIQGRLVQMAPTHLDKKANVEKMVGFIKEGQSRAQN